MGIFVHQQLLVHGRRDIDTLPLPPATPPPGLFPISPPPPAAPDLSTALSPSPVPLNFPATPNSLCQRNSPPLASPPSQPHIRRGLPLQLLDRRRQRHQRSSPPGALSSQYFGLFTNATSHSPFFLLAVEFNTDQKPQFNDLDDNSVGMAALIHLHPLLLHRTPLPVLLRAKTTMEV